MSETSLANLQRILNFYPLRNLASDELFFTSFIKFATALLYFVKKLNKLLSNF
ncbi:hypothetical protein HMPREF0401_02047 [Fusobacterium animalis 11_3_2]|uniref:Riboflavin synthase subunit alpha n=1 Tax=Fusobacterium animalis 11_3_2 TaxID=457403 RepID=F7L2K3_9FUSO|nr:hypothetical protein HMPREF0401_02047 [Fusobacterium animalis 11_3_2]